MDKDSPRSVLDVPVQMSDDGSVSDVFTDSEQRDLHYDAYSIDWQGRSIPYSSIGGGELGAPSSSTGPRRTSTTKGGVADMLLLFCAFNDGAADAGPVYLADEGDDGELEPAEEAVRQDSGGASTAEAESADDVYDSDSDAIYASESDPNGIIGDDFHAKYSIFTDDDDTNVIRIHVHVHVHIHAVQHTSMRCARACDVLPVVCLCELLACWVIRVRHAGTAAGPGTRISCARFWRSPPICV